MNGTQSQLPGGGDPQAQLRRDLIRDITVTDELAERLEYRVAALEEITAARWPRRWLLRARYGRHLRASVRNFPGATWADRRANAACTAWLADQPVQGSAQ